MSFTPLSFSPVGGNAGRGNGSQMHAYRTPDLTSEVTTDGYFNAVRDVVESGDAVYVASNVGVKQAPAMLFFDSVPKSPSLADVTMNAVEVQAV